MASFGGTVKLTGEAEYRKALTQITQNLRETSSALSLVDSQYAKNDNSVATVTEKNEKLNAILEKQKSAYENLKNSFTNIKAKYDEQVNSHNKLQAEYDEEKAKLDKLKNTLGENSSAYEKQKAKVGDLAVQLNKSQQNIDANEVAMSKLRVQMNNAEASINKTSKEIDNLGKETKETTEDVKQAGDGFTVFKGILANLGTQAINSAINSIKSLGGAFISVGKQAIESYADYEQLVGGVETLFKDSAPVVQKYANEAYKTAGLSANEYMETVTSFSASLLNSLDGDTKKAAELSNVAITDMSDNANKMGTDISMLQNAYSGFARGNYTMLDNLKLGFAGSKEGMQQLLDKANEYNASIGKNTNYQISSYADIVNAIHDVQTQMDITGTTAKEASTTISGSANAMKSAWSNLLTGMADDNADFEKLVGNLVDSIMTFGENILPRVHNVIDGIGTMVTTFLKEIVPKLLPILVDSIAEMTPTLVDSVKAVITSIVEVLPQLVSALKDLIPSIIQELLNMLPQLLDVGINVILTLIQGITDALPTLIAMLPDIIIKTVNTLVENLPKIIEAGIEVIFALVDGLIEALPTLIDYLPEIIDKVVMALAENMPKIVEAGITLIIKLAEGLIKAIPKLISKIPQIMSSLLNGITTYYGKLGEIGKNLLSKMISGIGSMLGSLGAKAAEIGTTIINKIRNLPNQMLSWGKDMIQGLINGITGMIGRVGDAVKGIANKIKNFLHFSRPDEGPLREYETWMPDMIEGLSNSLKSASPELIEQTRSLASDMSSAFTPNLAINGSYDGISGASSINYQDNYNSVVEAFKTALSEMKIELDDENMGKFIDSTVARTIYS